MARQVKYRDVGISGVPRKHILIFSENKFGCGGSRNMVILILILYRDQADAPPNSKKMILGLIRNLAFLIFLGRSLLPGA